VTPRSSEHQQRVAIALRLRDGLPVDHLLADLRGQRRWSAEIEKRRALAATVASRVVVPAQIETRSSGKSGQLRFEGYASVTERAYDLGPFMEVIASGAFANTLRTDPDVSFLVNHGIGGSIPLARTTNGSLKLNEDNVGLHFVANVNASRYPSAREVANAVADGLLKSCSFAFRCDKESFNDDYTVRRIEVCNLAGGDVSVVTNPASEHTSIGVSSRSAKPDQRSADYWIATATALRLKGQRPR
jgi:HK97 family phage prohead protease